MSNSRLTRRTENLSRRSRRYSSICGWLALALAVTPAGAVVAAPTLRADLSVSESQLSGHLPGWRDVTAAVSGRVGPDWTGIALVEIANRFNRQDTYFEARVDRRFGANAGYVAVGGTPNADFRPTWALRSGAAFALSHHDDGTILLIDADMSRFVPGDVVTAKIGVDQRLFGRDGRVVLQAVTTTSRRSGTQTGFTLTGYAPLGGRTFARLGVFDAPETSDGAPVRVRGWTGGLRFEASDDWALRGDLTQEDRRTYRRTEVALGLARRF